MCIEVFYIELVNQFREINFFSVLLLYCFEKSLSWGFI